MKSVKPFRTAARGSALLAASIAAALPMAAQAQSAPSEPQGALADVVVTAQRREQSLQTVPIAVTALTSADIEQRQIVNTYDLVQFVPNLHVFNNAGSLGTANAYYIRGIGNPESIATTDVPVGTYIDDVYVPRQQSANLNLFEVERVEVLRGPQGTLFGRNTTGGAVSIVTRKPSNERYVNAEVAYGRFNAIEARATANFPVTDTFYTMLSGFVGNDDGWIKGLVTGTDNYNEKQSWGGRAAFRWVPNDTVDWNVNLTRVYTANWRASNWAPTTAPQPLGIDGTYSKQWDSTLSRFRSCNDGDSPPQWLANGCNWNEVSETAVTSNLQFALGGVTLNAITGFRQMDHRYALDFIGNAPVGFSNFVITNIGDHDMFSQELKATGTAGVLTYTTGLFYMKEKNRTNFQDIFGIARGALFTNADRVLWNDTKSYAVYAQGDWKLAERITLTTGVRWTQEEKDLRLRFTRPTVFTEANIAGRPSFTDSKVTPKVSLQFQATDAMMYYVSATNGFKSGGWNGRATTPFAFRDFGPESVWSYEAGVRNDFFDRKLRLNATAFYAKYKDLQLNSAIPNTQPPVFIAQNAGDSRTKGIELELTARPIPSLTVFLNGGWQDAQFTRLSPEAITAGLSLKSAVAGTPDYSVDGGFTWDTDLPAGGLSFSTNAHYAPEFDRALTASRALVPSVFLVNANLTYTLPNRAWSVGLECTNCANRKYFPFGGAQADPLRYLVRVKYRP